MADTKSTVKNELMDVDVDSEVKDIDMEEEKEHQSTVEEMQKFEREDKEDTSVTDSEWRRQQANIENERIQKQFEERKKLAENLRNEEEADFKTEMARTGRERLKYLLKQSEIFAHFMLSKSDGPVVEPKKGKRGPKKGRMREREEDDLLMKEAIEEMRTNDIVHTRLVAQPSLIKNGTLRPYQLEGLNWLIRLFETGINGILADEMGLGKTLQTISFLAFLKEYRGIDGPFIVLAPKSTLGNWMREFAKWCPSIVALKFHGDKHERARLVSEELVQGRFDVCVTSYEMIIKEKAAFKKFIWRYLIIDEAHRIKNEESKLSKVVRELTTHFRLLITGTPLQNNLHELWSLLNFLLPDVFASAEDFDSWFAIGDHDDSLSKEEKEKQNFEMVQQLHKILRPFLLRRVKQDVEKAIPPKKEVILFIGMTDFQKKVYRDVLKGNLDALKGSEGSRVRLLNIVMQLRKACNHPYLFEGVEDKTLDPFGEHLIQNTGKLVLLDKLLSKLRAKRSQVLIFSQMTRMLDILEDYCRIRDYRYCRIDGNTSGDDRDSQIEDFVSPDSDKFLFLLSTRAGGLGINLATADTVILYDSDWNPQVDLQAMDRAHRIGQTKPVNVYRFITENSVEEKIIERATLKLQLDSAVIQQGRLTDRNKTLSKNEMLDIIHFGADAVFKPGNSMTEEDIDAILSRGEQKTVDMNNKLQQHVKKSLLDFTSDGNMNVYAFEGVDYSKEKRQEDKKALDVAILESFQQDVSKRERKRNYNEGQFYKTISASDAKKLNVPKPLRLPNMQDFQFYNRTRLFELQEIETNFYNSLVVKSNQGVALTEEEKKQALSPEETEEKQRLLSEAFSDWTRKDFNQFVRGCEQYGRQDLVLIANDIEGKTEEEVRKYAKVFWQRYKELNDWERVIKNIEKGEGRLQRKEEVLRELARKVHRYKDPWEQLTLSNYGASKGKAYTEEEDRFMLCMTHKVGYGKWDALKMEVRKADQFRFDYYFRSRTPAELGRRVDTLIRLIEKENKEHDEKGGPRAEEVMSATKLKKRKTEDDEGLKEVTPKKTPSKVGGEKKSASKTNGSEKKKTPKSSGKDGAKSTDKKKKKKKKSKQTEQGADVTEDPKGVKRSKYDENDLDEEGYKRKTKKKRLNETSAAEGEDRTSAADDAATGTTAMDE